MSYSSSLSNAEWKVLEPRLNQILPKKKRTCPHKWSQREIIDAILYPLKDGCNWSDLPNDFPPYSTVYWHYKQWRKAAQGKSGFVPVAMRWVIERTAL